MKYSIAYVMSVVTINLAFTYIPNVELFDGTLWSVGSIVAGFVFVARDYAQQEVGHRKVLLLMMLAAVLSYLMADPFVAVASVSAFAVSEICDYLVYTFKNGTHKQKVVLSSALSVPVDTFIFLMIIDAVSLVSFSVMVLSKMIAVSVIIFKKEGI